AAAIVPGAAAALGAKPLPSALVPKLCITEIPAGEQLFHKELGPDPEAVDSAICTYFQCGPCSVEQDSIIDLLCQEVEREEGSCGDTGTPALLSIMDKEAYAQLRTIEQLGYIVAVVPHSKWSVGGIRCLIQSVHSPTFLEERLENFLSVFEETLANMPDEELQEHVEGLVTKKLESDRNIDRSCQRIMNEVLGHTYEFERRKLEAAFIRKIDRAQLQAFYKTHLSVKSATRRRFSSHVVGKAAVDAGSEAAVTPQSKGKAPLRLLPRFRPSPKAPTHPA
ncbi:Metalloenzyme, LuxS/M16 peptidase-like protein, partial [Baffinella frigidus]